MKGYHKIDYSMYETNLSLKAILILSIMTDMQGDRMECFPKRSTLSSMLRCSLDSIDRAIEELVINQFITVIRVGKNRPNRYRVSQRESAPVGLTSPQNPEYLRLGSPQNTPRESAPVGLTSPHQPISEPTYSNLPNEPTYSNQQSQSVIFDFFELPDDPSETFPDDYTRRAASWLCINTCRDAGYFVDEQWKVGFQDWIKLADIPFSDKDIENIDFFAAQCKRGYKAKSLAAVIRSRIIGK